jgi:hypothetical protein
MNNYPVQSRLPSMASAEIPHDRQPFHKASTAMGAVGPLDKDAWHTEAMWGAEDQETGK